MVDAILPAYAAALKGVFAGRLHLCGDHARDVPVEQRRRTQIRQNVHAGVLEGHGASTVIP